MTRFFLVTLCVLLAILHCSRAPLAGGSTDTELGVITGSLYDEQGKPASNIPVLLLPRDYNPLQDGPLPDSLKDTTGARGVYTFKDVSASAYNIQARQIGANSATLITGIAVTAHDTLVLRADTLRQTGTVKIAAPEGVDTLDGYMYIPGTSIFARARTENGYVFLDSVPSGVLPSLLYVDKSVSAPIVLADSIAVFPGSVSIVSYETWQFSRKLYLNTTASGANVSGSTYGFPVLVRLTNNNFVFSQAKNDGSDIRFAKPDKTPLSYEIEHWDAVNQHAEIWVKIDTVFGNDSTHSFTMFWGNSNVASASNSSAVFDTALGFQGVWHLGQQGNATAVDATQNHYNGTPYGMGAASAVPGAIGTAQRFDGTSGYIQMIGTAVGRLNFDQQGTYYVSAWAYVNVLDSGWHAMVSKQLYQYTLQFRPKNVWEIGEYENGEGFEVSGYPAQAAVWTLVTGVRSGTKQYLYVNGELADSSIAIVIAGPLSRVASDDVTIGRLTKYDQSDSQSWRYFDGDLDEIRIGDVTCSPDWQRLCYMNQKSQDALLLFR